MGKKKKNKQLKHKPRKPDAYFINAIAAESDRGTVLVACAFLEYYLEMILRAHFMKINPENEKVINRSLDPGSMHGLFAMGAQKANACLLLGVISQYDFDVLAEVRNIRIACAHHPGEVPLDGETIAGLLEILSEEDNQTADWWIAHDAHPDNAQFPGLLGFSSRSFTEARLRFSHACISVLGRLSQTLNSVEERPLNYGLRLGSFTMPPPESPDEVQ